MPTKREMEAIKFEKAEQRKEAKREEAREDRAEAKRQDADKLKQAEAVNQAEAKAKRSENMALVREVMSILGASNNVYPRVDDQTFHSKIIGSSLNKLQELLKNLE